MKKKEKDLRRTYPRLESIHVKRSVEAVLKEGPTAWVFTEVTSTERFCG